jgi:hypothetical protein
MKNNMTTKVKFTPLTVTLETVDVLLKESGVDALGLYMAYASIAEWQKTKRIRATEAFMRKRLNWGKDKFRKNKKLLKDGGYIEDSQNKNEQGKIVGNYIEIRYVIHSPVFPPGGFTRRVENQTTSAYILKESAYILKESALEKTPEYLEKLLAGSLDTSKIQERHRVSFPTIRATAVTLLNKYEAGEMKRPIKNFKLTLCKWIQVAHPNGDGSFRPPKEDAIEPEEYQPTPITG